MRWSLLLSATVLSLAFAPAPLPRPPKLSSNEADLKAMQGKWARTHLKINGAVHPVMPGALTTITITNDRMVYSARDVWTMKLDAKASPKRLDTEGAVAPVQGIVFLGIYKMEKDKLILCCRDTRSGREDRPISFDPAQPGVWYQVFERVRP